MRVLGNFITRGKNNQAGPINSQKSIHRVSDRRSSALKPFKMQKHQAKSRIFDLFHGTFEDDQKRTTSQDENQR